jgi:hypothetical protein
MTVSPSSTSTQTTVATAKTARRAAVSIGILLREEAVVTALCAAAALSLWLSLFVIKDSVRALVNVG